MVDARNHEPTQSSQSQAGDAHGGSEAAPARPTVRAAGLIVREDAVLLVRQDRMGESYWLLPGGGVAFGEPLHDALVREFHEELALDIEPQRPVALVEAISDDMTRYPKHVIHIVVLAVLTDPRQKPTLGGDAAVLEARFVTRERLRGLRVTPPIGDFLDGWLEQPSSWMTYLGVRW
ncbi:MAG TPA: NUDIX domain-containing protein [Thermoleophilia bacterium]|nr:NUDIX domain-containing protein [Thermoleophilia bacterium]